MDANSYYALTEDSYLALCPSRTGHMNMGYWPALDVCQAQEQLINEVFSLYKRNCFSQPVCILDAGSGWGGSRGLFHLHFPNSRYFGVNLSQKQIAFASALNEDLPLTTYLHCDVHDLCARLDTPVDAVFSIEAAFHFPEKDTLLRSFKALGAQTITLAELCVEDRSCLDRARLLAPALSESWCSQRYPKELAAAGFETVAMEDISKHVFGGWAAYLGKVNPETFQGRRRILRQFHESFTDLLRLSREGRISYRLIHAQRFCHV